MKRLDLCLAAALLALACGAAAAQPAPRLGKVLQDRPEPKRGEPAVPFQPLPKASWSFARGEYRSVLSGVTLRLPQVGDEKVVSVREAIGTRTPEGDVTASHVLFVPNAEGTRVERYGPASAVVVTPLQPGASRQREALLQALEPRTPELRKKMAARGIEFRRVAGSAGDSLERVQPNRFVGPAFPYRMHVDETADRVHAMGVTRYLVWRDQALLEFSQVFPCRQLAVDACREAARRASERFVQGLVAYEPAKASVRPQGPSSAPKQGK